MAASWGDRVTITSEEERIPLHPSYQRDLPSCVSEGFLQRASILNSHPTDNTSIGSRRRNGGELLHYLGAESINTRLRSPQVQHQQRAHMLYGWIMSAGGDERPLRQQLKPFRSVQLLRTPGWIYTNFSSPACTCLCSVWCVQFARQKRWRTTAPLLAAACSLPLSLALSLAPLVCTFHLLEKFLNTWRKKKQKQKNKHKHWKQLLSPRICTAAHKKGFSGSAFCTYCFYFLLLLFVLFCQFCECFIVLM